MFCSCWLTATTGSSITRWSTEQEHCFTAISTSIILTTREPVKMMRGHCGDNSWRLSTVMCHCLLSEMMPLKWRLCLKQSYTERIKWMPSVSSCLHLEQLKAEHVIAEPQQALSHELLMAFHSVCTALCQCCACEPPSSTNWSKHSALLIAFGWSFWICVWMCVLCFAKTPLTTANKHSCRGSEPFETHSFWLYSQSQPCHSHSNTPWGCFAPLTSCHW